MTRFGRFVVGILPLCFLTAMWVWGVGHGSWETIIESGLVIWAVMTLPLFFVLWVFSGKTSELLFKPRIKDAGFVRTRH